MKLLTWNVNHRVNEKTIPPQMAEAIVSLEPDVFVLTEFVDGPSRESFKSDLKLFGFFHKISDGPKGQNQILIASRTPLVNGGIHVPQSEQADPPNEPLIPVAFPSNVMHVKVPDKRFDILGLRVPMPLKSVNRRACWEWIMATAKENCDLPFVIMGDFNIDRRYSPVKCGKRFDQLANIGMQHADAVPASDQSYFPLSGGRGTRIDHAFLSRHFINPKARYVSESSDYVFAGKKPGAMSDHAVLLVDADLKL
jgi:endonuclease/exonuclease/phosphatase family metal-dependent hydrolase